MRKGGVGGGWQKYGAGLEFLGGGVKVDLKKLSLGELWIKIISWNLTLLNLINVW